MAGTRIGQYGFEYGPGRVIRMCSEDKYGVWILVQGLREEITIRVTKGGRLRLSPVTKTHVMLSIDP